VTPQERARRNRAATAAARAEMLAWREAQIERLREILQAMAAEFGAELDRLAGADGLLPVGAIDAMNRYIEQRIGEFDTAFQRVLMDGLRRSATMGSGVLGILPVQGDAAAATALRNVVQFTGKDGLQLSDRLWRAGQRTRDVMRAHILGGIERGRAASTAALELMVAGKPLLNDVRAGLQAGQARTMKDLVRR
jgi:hypothetical protein